MKLFLKRILLTAGCLVTADWASAQDIHFSQFYENAILRNPALTGIFSGDYKVGLNYRNQWSSISVPFQTGLASVESRIAVNKETGDYLSFGATLTYDRAGSINFNSTQIYPAINYNKALEDVRNSYLSAGFTLGYVQRSVDPAKMVYASQFQNGNYNPGNVSGESPRNVKMDFFDVGAGVSFNSSAGRDNAVNYYLGAAAYHVNKPKASFDENESFVRLRTKWNANMGFQWMIDPFVGLTFHANYSRQNPYTELILGSLLSWRKLDGDQMNALFIIHGGLFYRYKDAFIPTVKIDYQKYSMTFSYDINSSTLRTASSGAGGFEISLSTRGNFDNLSAKDKTKCPRFEQMSTLGIGD
ncbi:MAG TPA: PorP/SprF family type IX secretion system membrane protein [Flavipsychrobacter sp.]|nr:PorP/SprF family type IX secretion system membrane protein [Flavipsychrobacter sp.]